MKQKTIVLIDGENISAKNADRIVSISSRFGAVVERKVYHHRKDQSTRQWTDKSRNGSFQDIGLHGSPAKDKVDHRIQADAREYLKQPDVGTVCIVTSDGGFRCLVSDASTAGKKLCFIVGKQASRKLRNCGARFYELG